MRTTALLLLLCLLFLANAWSQPYVISTLAGAPRLSRRRPGDLRAIAERRSRWRWMPTAIFISPMKTTIGFEKWTLSGIISTYAGTGVPGYSGDRGPAANAQLNFPTGIALDAKGNLYVADAGNVVIRRIAADGTINTVAGQRKPEVRRRQWSGDLRSN